MGANNVNYDHNVDEDSCMDICSIQRSNWVVPSNRRTCRTFNPYLRDMEALPLFTVQIRFLQDEQHSEDGNDEDHGLSSFDVGGFGYPHS